MPPTYKLWTESLNTSFTREKALFKNLFWGFSHWLKILISWCLWAFGSCWTGNSRALIRLWRKFLAHIWIAVTILWTNRVCLCTWTHSTRFWRYFGNLNVLLWILLSSYVFVIQMLPSLIVVMRMLSPCVICSDILLDPLAQYVKKKHLTNTIY